MDSSNKRLLGGFLLLAVAVGVGLAIYFAPKDEQPSPDPENNQVNSSRDQALPLPELGGVPDFGLIDQTGTSFGSSELKNKVWLANFIFSSCQGTCPAQSERMSELQARLSGDPSWPGIRLVTFTVDPENDTPEVLKGYAEVYGADSDHWKFLTGERSQIWELCKAGFKMQVSPNPDDKAMPILHDTQVVLIDRQGQIRGYYDALVEDDRTRLIRDIGMVLPEFQPAAAVADQFASDVTHLAQPPQILQMEWLDDLKQQQTEEISKSKVFHGFQFEDKVDQTGIAFEPQIVDEQRWRLQVNHYDHGTGICVADVDGDGYLDVYFLSQAGANELWKNRGDGTFEDITDQAGVGLDERISVTASFADIDNDGDADLYVTTVRGGNALLVNNGQGQFEDVTPDSGLDYSGHSSAPVFFDYDKDGLLDMYLCNVGRYTTEDYVDVRQDATTNEKAAGVKYYTGIKDAFGGHLKSEYNEKSRLFHNEGSGKFKDETTETGIDNVKWTGDATPIDGNKDGWPDLYVLNMQGLDGYFENQEGKRFVDKSGEYFPRTSWGAMGVKSFDLENDGDFDLLVTDMHSDMSEDVGPEREQLKSRMQWPEMFLQSNEKGIYGNSLFQKQDDGQFQEISDQFGAENYWPWGISVADLNADGFLDVFVASSMCFPYRYGINSVWLNDAGTQFVPAEFALGVEPRPPQDRLKPWFELDCENVDKDNPICRGRSGKIIVWSSRGTRSSAIFDLDGDGDLDILTNEFNSRPMALISDLSDQRTVNWLKIRFRGTVSNRDGLGCVVSVKLPSGKTLTQCHDGKSGYLSQSSQPLYFGLGDVSEVTSIEIRWPSGTSQQLEGPIKAGQLLTVEESKPAE